MTNAEEKELRSRLTEAKEQLVEATIRKRNCELAIERAEAKMWQVMEDMLARARPTQQACVGTDATATPGGAK